MLFGISGASGTGKTTLGGEVAEALGIEFVKTDVTGMARAAGYEAVSDLPLGERVDLQEKLFQGFERLTRETAGPAILDRTPLDLVMYLMGEVNMHSHKLLAPEQRQWVADYVHRCQVLTAQRFAHLFITTPFDNYEESETRPSWNPGYQRHCHLILMGTIGTFGGGRHSLTCTILKSPERSHRYEATFNRIVQKLDELDAMRRTSRNIH